YQIAAVPEVRHDYGVHMRRHAHRRSALVALAIMLTLSACTDSAVDSEETVDAVAGGPPTTTAPTSTTVVSTTTVTQTEPTETEGDVDPTGSGCGAELASGQSTVSFDFEDRTRVYELVVPPTYDPNVPTPLVMNWHGLGSNGPDQLGFSEYPPLAAKEGFLVVAPTGVPTPGLSQNSWELTDADDPTRDDLAFAEVVLDRVIATACVDEARVYTTGMSNGGYFSSRLVCELADRIAGAASVAALAHPDDCDPSRPVPYIGFHGVDDEVVPYDGGGLSSLAPGVRVELFEAIIPEEFAEFAATFGCEPTPIEQALSEDVTAFEYEGCADGVEAVFYRLDNAGHTWPGSNISLAISQASGLGVTNTDVNATELSWELFSRHSLE
ncbi:MAG: alpha/beta hydrolase family esterase, partial [Acidimicrobiales bacterium]